jgi:dihydrofolate synthase/folylpolyglutamate synthase
MRIEQATAFLYSLKPQGIRFGLENTRLVLDKLGVLQPDFEVVHIAGSNGKGSTAAFLDGMLRKENYQVGLYTSPHLNHYRERFRVNGIPVADDEIVEATRLLLQKGLELDPAEVTDWVDREEMVRKMASGTWYHRRGGASEFCRLTFFECTTILAVLLFQAKQVDLAIMEVGMGGRLDATNVLSPLVSVITPIHLEHTSWLGETLALIAGEKAGIIKPEIPVVCARQADEARQVIETVSAELKAPLHVLGRDFECQGDWRQASFRAADRTIGPVRLGLAGEHQVGNAATAVGCLPILKSCGWEVGEQAATKGLRLVSWPARFERLGEQGQWILDGAHNPDGAQALAGVVRDVFGDERVRLVFGVLEDKRVDDMLTALDAVASSVDLVRPADARGRDPNELRMLVDGSAIVHESVTVALSRLEAAPGPPVLITGSLTVVGEARSWLQDKGYSVQEMPP